MTNNFQIPKKKEVAQKRLNIILHEFYMVNCDYLIRVFDYDGLKCFRYVIPIQNFNIVAELSMR